MAEKAPQTPPEPLRSAVTPAPIAAVLEQQQEVAANALQRQLTKKPPRQKLRIQVDATIRGQAEGGVYEAYDEGEAWALLCDSKKIPESLRSPKFAQPRFKVLGPAQSA